MFDRTATAALGISAVTLLLVLLRPVPVPPAEDSLRDVERIVLSVGSEEDAVTEERRDLAKAFDNIAEMRQRFERGKGNGPDPLTFASSAAAREVAARWKEYQEHLKVLNAYRTRSRPQTPGKR